jgi:hypothetical protein
VKEDLKTLIKIQLLSWFVLMSKDDYDKNDSDIADIILKLNRYLNKRKKDIISKSDQNLMENKLYTIRDTFEKLIVKPEYHHELDTDKDLPTINYSPTLLAIQCLDDLLLSCNTEFRVRFGHIDTGKLLIQIEEYDGSLTMDSLKLYHNLKKEIGV